MQYNHYNLTGIASTVQKVADAVQRLSVQCNLTGKASTVQKVADAVQPVQPDRYS